MKKSSPFVNIPTLPTTFSGQWLTFSHMANHYRKLINVKPRVDTNVPRSSFNNVVLSKSSSKQLKNGGVATAKTLKNNNGSGGQDSSNNINNSNTANTSKVKTKWTRPKMASRMLDYEYHALSKGLMNSPNGSFKGSSSDGYQVVFGPSSIKSSVDAIVSDPEITREPEPQLSSISIGEKIRKFLDHIHSQESQHKLNNNNNSSNIGSRPLSSRERRDQSSKSREQLTETRHNRHSKCFTPFDVTAKGTKKRIVKPSRHRSQRLIDSPILSSTESRRSLTANATLSRDRERERELQRERQRALIDIPKTMMNVNRTQSYMLHHQKSQSININNHNNFEGLLSSFGPTSQHNNSISSKKITKIPKRKTTDSPNISPRSVSVGTIRGSDDLETEEFLMPASPTLPRNLSTIQIDTGDLPASWLKEKVEQGVVQINNAYFQMPIGGGGPGSSISSIGIQHDHDHDHNHSHNHSHNQDQPEKDDRRASHHHHHHSHSHSNHGHHRPHRDISNTHFHSSAHNLHPNKDSSRDSAYGFSSASGESRMTTRESTPEKKPSHSHSHHHNNSSQNQDHHHHHHHHHSHSARNSTSTTPIINTNTHSNGNGNGVLGGKSSTKPIMKGSLDVNGRYKSSLSTVASSINQDDSSHNNTGDSSGHSSCSEKSILRHCASPSPYSTSSSHNKIGSDLLLDEKYINFLTIVTDDIVSRGIYTNKGIKNALKSHLMKRSDLEMDKMFCLLERLRMDMGVPKDDSLNAIEFGYGSVQYSSGPFFFKNKEIISPTDPDPDPDPPRPLALAPSKSKSKSQVRIAEVEAKIANNNNDDNSNRNTAAPADISNNNSTPSTSSSNTNNNSDDQTDSNS